MKINMKHAKLATLILIGIVAYIAIAVIWPIVMGITFGLLCLGFLWLVIYSAITDIAKEIEKDKKK